MLVDIGQPTMSQSGASCQPYIHSHPAFEPLFDRRRIVDPHVFPNAELSFGLAPLALILPFCAVSQK